MKTQTEVEAELKALIEQHDSLTDNPKARELIVPAVNALAWVLGRYTGGETLCLSQETIDLYACF